MITSADILLRLPEYRDDWVDLKSHQYVPDIMQEVCAAHTRYAGYYDYFSDLFLQDHGLSGLADQLYTFCKDNIEYREEQANDQTTALPTGILIRGYGDCKHYALFNGGVIDSIRRRHYPGLRWNYDFAGYNGSKEVGHVFVSMQEGNGKVWIDPTPGSMYETPTLLIEKRP